MLRAIVVAATLGLAPLIPLPAAAPALAQAAPGTMTIDELMRATALDDIFTQFGPAIASAPEEQGMPLVGAQKAAWQAAAGEVFDARRMHSELANALAGRFDPEDIEAFAGFYGSPFGIRISAIEREIALLPPDAQASVREQGLRLAGLADATRNAQIDEMLRLVSADIATAIVRQSVRGMMIGMSVADQQGDIEVPWEEIDAHLDTIMPGIEADVVLTQRAMMLYAYRDLSEAELEDYLVFLRTLPAQKLYAIAAYSIGEIVTGHMEAFGEALARRLAQVNV